MDSAVAEWFDQTENPLKLVIRAVRDVIMEDPDIEETVKYRAPAFEYEGIVCYFNWSAKKRVSLIFPDGRRIPGDFPMLEDGSNIQRMMYFDDVDDVAAKKADLQDILAACVAYRS